MKKIVNKKFEKIKEELGNPTIRLLSRNDWNNAHKKGWGLGSSYGKACWECNSIVLKQSRTGKDFTNTIYHEILHLLFKHRPHWWIEESARILTKQSKNDRWGRYSLRYNKRLKRTRESLIKLCNKASLRIEQKSLCNRGLGEN